MALSRKTLFVFLTSFSLTILTCLPLGAEQLETTPQLGVDSLSEGAASGQFPAWWKTYPFQKGRAKTVYKVQEENGKRFIHAQDDKDISIPIFKDFGWDLKNYSTLQWDWRAVQMPQGGREDSRATNDSACGVYVAFGRWSGVALKYVWSSTLPVGHVWEKEPGKFYIIVLASGASQLNQWKSEKVNVVEDFKKYFKKDPSKNPSGIGIMTDGNATHTPAACDYTDFTISKS
jgi:DUF3047 family protein